MTTPFTTDDLRESGGVGRWAAVRRRIGSPAAGWVLWGANVAVMVMLCVWVLSDVKFHETVIAQMAQLHAITHAGSRAAPIRQLGYRVELLWMLAGAGTVTLIGVIATLFAGAAAHRSLRSWFAFTLLIAAWLTMYTAWPEIAWQGQRLRLWCQLSRFESVAASLRDNWPTRDGERVKFGSFMAYPKGNPHTLIVLKSASTPPILTPPISAVERTNEGGLNFELRGALPGTWLEWHPANSPPHDFTGGLENEYHVQRSSTLGGGWYLVRYR